MSEIYETAPSLADALARPHIVQFAGKPREIRVLNFNDLADLEEKFGDIEDIDTAKVATQRYLVWFILSRCDGELTETEVGAGMTLDKGKEVGEFIRAVFALSGFKADATGAEGDSPNAPETAAAPEAASVSGSTTSSASSSSAAGTRRRK